MLIDEMVFPVFKRRFSKKLELIENKNPKLVQKVMSIKTEADCIVYGPDCVVAIDRFNETIQKFYRIFAILNKEYRLSSPVFGWNRYIGTLLANMNFELDTGYHEKNIHMPKVSGPKSTAKQGQMASMQLQTDLVKLLQHIVPSKGISITDMISFLGYTEISGNNKDNLKSKHSTTKHSTSNKPSPSPVSGPVFNSSLPQWKRFNSIYNEKFKCNVSHYVERWQGYLLTIDDKPNNQGENRTSGNFSR
jgi:hypothetical protein